ncbi:hypothetical protein N802_12290 [Knoellia sinensis KCTC 19936]|uniref:SMP-30/Gluconolactonase/LRE-like region domain-containing protein n=2 Tax=Knoellia TaxID=136099 RepID=A0A0A0JAJ9_9MICO|nr:hypothetical protein N802_12290 [Knoellia sinensis KCTC 19936]
MAAAVLSATLVGGGLAPTSASAATASSPDSTCAPWTKAPVAQGFGTLENLAFDGRGGLLLSETNVLGPGGALKRLTPDGQRGTLVANVTAPGGIVVHGNTVSFTTGNSPASGFLGIKDGTISSVDLDSGAVTTVATGLTMPNGLERLPDGTFVASRDVGPSTTLTAVKPSGEKAPYAPSVTSTNGLAFDPTRRALYVASTFTLASTVSVVDVDNPSAQPKVLTIPGIGPLNSADDLTVGPDGEVYVALNVAGSVVRVDPDSGATCTIASGLPLSSSVAFGSGPGWDPTALYVTSFLGTVTRLTA